MNLMQRVHRIVTDAYMALEETYENYLVSRNFTNFRDKQSDDL